MAGKARQGDAITPIGHGGAIGIPGQGSVSVNGSLLARIGDPVACGVHGAQTITTGSGTVSCAGKAVARIGDGVSCGAVIVGGSANVTAN